MNTCTIYLPSIAIIWRKRIAKFCITRWRAEVSMFLKIGCRHTRTCCLKLKLSRKLFLSHKWAVVVRIIRLNYEDALRNAISRHFQKKNEQQKPTQWYWKKIANVLNLTAKFECDTPNSFRLIDTSFQPINYWSRCINYKDIHTVMYKAQTFLRTHVHISF